jgi:hypothetical protein
MMNNLLNTIAVYSSILISLFAAANETNITSDNARTIIDKAANSYFVSTSSLNVATDYVGIWQIFASINITKRYR